MPPLSKLLPLPPLLSRVSSAIIYERKKLLNLVEYSTLIAKISDDTYLIRDLLHLKSVQHLEHALKHAIEPTSVFLALLLMPLFLPIRSG